MEGQPLALNWQVLIEVADRSGAETNELFFEKIKAWETEVRIQIRKG